MPEYPAYIRGFAYHQSANSFLAGVALAPSFSIPLTRLLFSSSARARRRWVGLFFGLLTLLGLGLHRDYGIPWDEQVERFSGIISAKYVALRLAPALARREENFSQIPDLHANPDADHGVFFQLPLVVLERLLGVDDTRDVYFLRHLVVFLTFVGGVYVFYRLAAQRFGSWAAGLLGAAALVLSPRLFAEAFYNYKDLVFLVFFTVGIYTLVRLLRRPTGTRVLLHAAVSAAAVDVRIMGVLLVPLTLFFMGLEAFFRPPRRAAFGWLAGLYLPLTAVVVVVGWPYLWENPLRHFQEAFAGFSRYHPSDRRELYLGQEVLTTQLPWHYTLVWLLVTTPVLYVGLAGVGGLGLLRTAGQSPWRWLRTRAGRQDLLFAAWFLGPLLAVVVFHSVLYDGWRHSYFIYPAFLLLALRGTHQLWRAAPARWARLGGLAVALLGVAHPLYRMVRDHPYQNMYYGFLSGTTAERLFERDYWGLATRQGIEWILAQDASAQVTIGTEPRLQVLLYNGALLLPPAERKRVVRTIPAQARYFVTNYRFHPSLYPTSYGREVYTIRVDGSRILSVFQRY